METVKDFIDALVKVELIGDSNQYGHYPFQLWAEKHDGTTELNALAVGDVRLCYKRTKQYIKEIGVKKLFLSTDFPKSQDIEHDFIAIYSYIDEKIDISAIPYNIETGELYEMITSAKLLDLIRTDFESVVLK